MNKNILIATGLVAGASALIYLLRKRKRSVDSMQRMPVTPSRHLTDSFAKAKQHASTGGGQRISMSDKI